MTAMTAIPTGAHTLTIKSRGTNPTLFGGNCGCGWYTASELWTRAEVRELHDAHLQAVLSEMEANDAS